MSMENRVKNIEQRNRRVELDKTWETSYTRRGLLTVFTYLTIGFYGMSIGIKDPWLNAVIPAVAFLLSTATLPFFKQLWRNRK